MEGRVPVVVEEDTDPAVERGTGVEVVHMIPEEVGVRKVPGEMEVHKDPGEVEVHKVPGVVEVHCVNLLSFLTLTLN